MKQDEFIKEYNEYFLIPINEVSRYKTIEVNIETLFNFINHLLSKQKPSVSDEADKIIKRLDEEIGYTTEAIKLTNGSVKQELESEIEFFNQIKSLLQSLPPQVVQSEVSEILDDIRAIISSHNDVDVIMEHISPLVKSLTPPDAEKEAVMFAEWIGLKTEKDSWFKRNVNFGTWYVHLKGNITTQELFTLYKQGGK